MRWSIQFFLMFLLVPNLAHSATWLFSGTVTRIDFGLVTDIGIGDHFTLTVAFDPSTPNLTQSLAGYGTYQADSINATVGKYSGGLTNAPGQRVIVNNGYSAPNLDRLAINTGLKAHDAPLQGDRTLVGIHARLEDTDGLALSNDSLPMNLPALSNFESTEFSLQFSNNFNPAAAFDSKGVFGEITEVRPVPLPAAAWLLGTGLVGFAGLSLRKREQKHRTSCR